jgi:prepilin-type N-terminal cleavage/methylation domain-containing protein
MSSNKQKSFTLIELLTVIAVIGLLSTIVLISIKSAKKDADLKRVMAFSASIQHALGSAAIGTWSFEDNIDDSSGNSNNGTWVGGGGPTYIKGIINKAVQFNGSNYIKVPYSDRLNSKSGAITIELWVYWRDVLSHSSYFISNYHFGGSYDYTYYCVNFVSYYYCRIYDKNDQSATFYMPVIKIGDWLHVVLTYDGKGKARMFLNAEEYLPYYVTRNFNSSVRTSRDLYIGGDPEISSLDGMMMDEVRIYDSYITLAEVQKHYAQGLFNLATQDYINNFSKK